MLNALTANSCKNPSSFCDLPDEGQKRGSTSGSGSCPPRQMAIQTRSNMKALLAVIIAVNALSCISETQADGVRGYFRSNGTYVAPHYRSNANGTAYDNYSYRSPSCGSGSYTAPKPFTPAPNAIPRYHYNGGTPGGIGLTSGYFRSDGTFVAPYLRTSPNSIPYDNLGYRW